MTATLETKANGLELYKEQSYNQTGLTFSFEKSFFEEIKPFIQEDSYFIVYLDYAVVIGTYKNHEFLFVVEDGKGQNGNILHKTSNSFESKFIQKLRIFNQSKELYIWRTSQDGERVFKGRLREDNSNHPESKEVEFVQADQILFGTTSVALRQAQGDKVEFTKLTEERGTEIILPYPESTIDFRKQGDPTYNANKHTPDKRIAIRTRNYLGYNEIGQAGYVDCRFVEFVKRDKDHTYTWDEVKKDWIEET